MQHLYPDVHFENGLGFQLSPEDKKLVAVIVAGHDKIELTSSLVKQRLRQEGFGHLFVSEYLLFELIRRYKNASDGHFEFAIGEQRDATCDIRISKDNMRARLYIAPCYGGQTISLEDVENKLSELGIVFGIVAREEIEAAIAQGAVADFEIAQGIEAIEGTPTQFECLIEQTAEKKPLVNDDGSVDYRELGDIVIVHEGDLLMQRIAPKQGSSGCDIFGKELLPIPVADVPFAVDGKSVRINPDNKEQLLATMTGQPSIVENGMIVSPVMTVDKVDLETGNVRFDGSLVIKGSVIESMKVFALRDVFVNGDVINSRIECMGNLNIKGGVTGKSELIAGGDVKVQGGVQSDENKLDEYSAKIVVKGGLSGKSELVAGGDVEIKGGVQGYQQGEENDEGFGAKIIAYGSVVVGFAENFTIESDVDIVVEKYAMNSTLMAKRKIAAGGKGGRKSSIIGGISWASKLIKATLVGAETGIRTFVRVGSNPHVEKRMAIIRHELAENDKKQQSVRKSLIYVRDHPEKGDPEMFRKLHYLLQQLTIQSEDFHAELKELHSNIELIDDAKVVADRGVYVGTTVRINSGVWQAKENRGKSIFRLERREIVIDNR